jgi:hypothetical protein
MIVFCAFYLVINIEAVSPISTYQQSRSIDIIRLLLLDPLGPQNPLQLRIPIILLPFINTQPLGKEHIHHALNLIIIFELFQQKENKNLQLIQRLFIRQQLPYRMVYCQGQGLFHLFGGDA